MAPDDPLFATLEAEQLKLHGLKLKLAIKRQLEVDGDITNKSSRSPSRQTMISYKQPGSYGIRSLQSRQMGVVDYPRHMI